MVGKNGTVIHGEMNLTKRVVYLITGPLLMVFFLILLPKTGTFTTVAALSVGTVAWMAFWWVTRPVDLAVTAFLPIVINAFYSMTDMKGLISNYSSETIVLLFSSSVLAVSMEKTGLDKRIAARFLSIIGENLRLQLVFWYILSALLSSLLPNAVVCATITPIAVSMLRYAGEGNIAQSKIGSKVLLYIAYGVGVGGLFSPLGGAMNLVTVDYLQQVTGSEFMYIQWVIRFLPIMLVLISSNIIFMLRDVKKNDALNGSKEYFKEQYNKMPKITIEEMWSLALFVTASLLSFARPLYEKILPEMKPAYVFTACAVLAFIIPNSKKQFVMKWKEVQGKLVWELIFVFAGGLAAGALIKGSGAAEAIGTLVKNGNMSDVFVMVLAIISITLLLSDVTSNTATASVAIPIVISVANGLNMNPVPWVYIATIGVNLSYMLPTSIRAIPVGYGL